MRIALRRSAFIGFCAVNGTMRHLGVIETVYRRDQLPYALQNLSICLVDVTNEKTAPAG